MTGERGAGVPWTLTLAVSVLEPAGGTLTFDELVPLKVSGVAFRWRARVATNNPLFPHTAWFSMPGNGLTEAKLRSPGTSHRRR